MLSRWLGEKRWKSALHLDYASRLYFCNQIGHFPSYGARLWSYRRLAGWKIGQGTQIHRGARLFCLGGVEIGTDSLINGECWLDGRAGLRIGDRVSIAIGSRLLTLSHNAQDANFSTVGKPIVIEDYAWLGAFCLILPGVTIGRGAVVGAGSVVTRDIPEYSIAVGNPAQVVALRSQDLDYVPHYCPLFF